MVKIKTAGGKSGIIRDYTMLYKAPIPGYIYINVFTMCNITVLSTYHIRGGLLYAEIVHCFFINTDKLAQLLGVAREKSQELMTPCNIQSSLVVQCQHLRATKITSNYRFREGFCRCLK